jgi:RNA-directed DNA polymerase
MLASRTYEWVVEGDIEACFDTIDHTALMDRVRLRVEDRCVLALVKAFLKAGILSQDGARRDTDTGTPQGGILSPLLANIALSILAEHFAQIPGGPATKKWERRKRRQRGQANYRLIRYADDFLVMVSGDRDHAILARDTVAAVLAPMGLRLSEAKTMITHIEAGLDFLGWRIQRHRKRGTTKRYVYTVPSRKAVQFVKDKVKAHTYRATRHKELKRLIYDLNGLLRGWANYFRHAVAKDVFNALDTFAWLRVANWLFRKHAKLSGAKCGAGSACRAPGRSPMAATRSPAHPASQ